LRSHPEEAAQRHCRQEVVTNPEEVNKTEDGVTGSKGRGGGGGATLAGTGIIPLFVLPFGNGLLSNLLGDLPGSFGSSVTPLLLLLLPRKILGGFCSLNPLPSPLDPGVLADREKDGGVDGLLKISNRVAGDISSLNLLLKLFPELNKLPLLLVRVGGVRPLLESKLFLMLKSVLLFL